MKAAEEKKLLREIRMLLERMSLSVPTTESSAPVREAAS